MPNLTLFFTAAFFVLGSIIGSFLSVVIYRIYNKKKGILLGRSICPKCETQLGWRDMVPVFSYIFLRGKCRFCKSKISIHYFLLELSTGIAFSLIFLRFNFLNGGSPFELIFLLILTSLAIALSFFDQQYFKVPIHLSAPYAIIGGLGAFFILGVPWQSMLIGAALGKAFFWIQYKLSKGKWMGLGDSDIGLGIGLILGWKMLILSVFASYLIASTLGILLLITQLVTRKTKIAFGPYLLLGCFLILLYETQILEIYKFVFIR